MNQAATTISNLTVNQGNITLTDNPLALSANSTWSAVPGSSLTANNGSLNLTSSANFNLQVGTAVNTGLVDLSAVQVTGTGNVTLAGTDSVVGLKMSGNNNYWGGTTISASTTLQWASGGTPLGSRFGFPAVNQTQLTFPSSSGTTAVMDMHGNSGTIGIISSNGNNGLITTSQPGPVTLTISATAALSGNLGGSNNGPQFTDGAGKLSLTIVGSSQTITFGSSRNIPWLMNGNGNHISGTVTIQNAIVQAWQNNNLLYGAAVPYNNLNPFGTADVVLNGSGDPTGNTATGGVITDESSSLDIPSLSGNGNVMAIKLSSSHWQNSTVFIGSNNHDSTYSGTYYGAVHLQKVGTGTFTYSGTNSMDYDNTGSELNHTMPMGVTEINGGVFVAAVPASRGKDAFGDTIQAGRLLMNGGTLKLTTSFDYSGDLSTSGSGAVVSTNGCNFFNGSSGTSNTYYVGSSGSLVWSGGVITPGNTGPGGATWKVDLNGQTTTWASNLKDGGPASDPLLHASLSIINNNATPGKLILTGSDTYVGPTTVDPATLEVDGSLTASPLTVLSGGTLSGIGSLANVEVKAGGVLRPAITLGTMTLSSGSLVLDAGVKAYYQLDDVNDSANVQIPSYSLTLSGQNFGDFTFDTSNAFNFLASGTSYPLISANSVIGSLGPNTAGTVYDIFSNPYPRT